MKSDEEEYIPKRFSQTTDRSQTETNRILEKASAFIRGGQTPERAIKDPESYKRRQFKSLKQFALLHHLWIDPETNWGEFYDRGGENEVFFAYEKVYKLNNFEYAGDDLINFFDRIKIHNHLFPDVAYSLKGFTENQEQELCAVLEQPFIKSEREASEEDIKEYMHALDFKDGEYNDVFTREDWLVYDATPHNVLVGIDERLYFIDTQIIILKE